MREIVQIYRLRSSCPGEEGSGALMHVSFWTREIERRRSSDRIRVEEVRL